MKPGPGTWGTLLAGDVVVHDMRVDIDDFVVLSTSIPELPPTYPRMDLDVVLELRVMTLTDGVVRFICRYRDSEYRYVEVIR